MNLLRLGFIMVLWWTSLAPVWAETVLTEAGWHLKYTGALASEDLDQLFQDQTELKSVWGWDSAQSQWQVKSKNTLQVEFLPLTELVEGQGYWFYTKGTTTLPSPSESPSWSFAENANWHLLGTKDELTATAAVEAVAQQGGSSGGETLWSWDGELWRVFVNGDKPDVLAAIEDMETLPANSGFWVNLNGQSDSPPFSPRIQDFNTDILQGYATCQELRYDVDEAGKYLANLVITSTDEGPHYYSDPWWGGFNWPLIDIILTETSGAGGDETNNQVSGVDEGDMVKSDGQRLYIGFGNELVIHDLSGNVLDRYALPESENYALSQYSGEKIVEILINNSKVLIISRGYYHSEERVVSGVTRLNRLEVDTEGKLTHLEEKWINGRFNTSRLIGDRAHIITFSNLHNQMLTEPLRRSNFEDMSDAEYKDAATAMAYLLIPTWREALMGQLFETSDLQNPEACQHILQISRMQQGGDTEDLEFTDGMGILNAFAQIQSFSMDQGFSTQHIAGGFVPTQTTTSYAHPDMFVIGGAGWDRSSWFNWNASTFLMSFSIDSGNPVPQSLGSVPGSMLDQFSMDYYNEHLRVASTINQSWEWNAEEGWTDFTPSQGVVTILKPNGSELEMTGEVRGLGVNERIFATRFIEDRGFVVTFRQIDPFYTLDLSDPNNPQQVGELKIPGFSTYLHPMGDDHILAIGRESGVQLALYDVSNMADPVQLHKKIIPGHSEAQGDHRAFRYLPTEKKLILPFKDSYRALNSFRIFNVDATEGITDYGTIDPVANHCSQKSTIAPRSMVYDNQLITMSDFHVSSHTLDPLESQWNSTLGGTDVRCTQLEKRLSQVRFINGVFVAAREGQIYTSPDGVEWTKVFEGNEGWGAWGVQIEPIENGALVFSYNKIISSNDMLTWTSTENTHHFRNVAFGNGIYLGHRSSGIYRSSNGSTWERITAQTSEGEFSSNKIVFFQGKFYGKTFNSDVYSSADGLQWEQVYENTTVGNISLSGSTAASSRVLSTGAEVLAIESPTVDISTGSISVASTLITAIETVETVLTNATSITISIPTIEIPDIIIWTPTVTIDSSIIIANWGSTFETNGDILILSGTNQSITSNNGTDWTVHSDLERPFLSNIKASGGTFVGTSGVKIYTSTDGVQWTATSLGIESYLHSAAKGNGVTVALSGKTIITATDPAD